MEGPSGRSGGKCVEAINKKLWLPQHLERLNSWVQILTLQQRDTWISWVPLLWFFVLIYTPHALSRSPMLFVARASPVHLFHNSTESSSVCFAFPVSPLLPRPHLYGTMKALVGSSPGVLPGHYRGQWFSSPVDPRLRFLRRQRPVCFGILNLISVQHMPIHPIRSSSSEAQVELETEETEIQIKSPSKTVHVRWQLHKQCSFGEQFFVVGDDPMVGLWDPSSAVPLFWSDGNVWTAELDVPIGKSIQFKFILKGTSGTILWQPGPDRILHTWATENIITVIEDWEDAELQKIIEGPIFVGNEEPVINSDALISVGEATERISDTKKESTIIVTSALPVEKAPAGAQKKFIVADSIPQSQQKPTTMVAGNITYLKEEDPLANADELQTKIASSPQATLDKDVLIEGNMLADKGRAGPIKTPGITEIKSLISHEEGPVLVPGLTPLSTIPTKETNQDSEKKSILMDASVVAMEAKDQTVAELDNKQEPEGERHHEDTIGMVLNDEKEKLQGIELEQLAKQDNMNSDSDGNGFLMFDMQWGCRTLQKFLTNFGFPPA